MISTVYLLPCYMDSAPWQIIWAEVSLFMFSAGGRGPRQRAALYALWRPVPWLPCPWLEVGTVGLLNTACYLCRKCFSCRVFTLSKTERVPDFNMLAHSKTDCFHLTYHLLHAVYCISVKMRAVNIHAENKQEGNSALYREPPVSSVFDTYQLRWFFFTGWMPHWIWMFLIYSLDIKMLTFCAL